MNEWMTLHMIYLVCGITLVSYQSNFHVWTAVLFDPLHPSPNIRKTLCIGHVEYNHNSHREAIINGSRMLVLFRAARVPDMHFDDLPPDVNFAHFQVYYFVRDCPCF